MSVVLTLFLGFHLYIAAFGMTTNEYYKWRHIKKWHKRTKNKYEQALKDGIVTESHTSVGKDMNVSVDKDVDVGCTGPVEKESSQDMDESSTSNGILNPGPFPENIYDLGILENYKEILFPRSLRKEALDRYEMSRKQRNLPSEECSKVPKTKDI